MSSSTHGIHLGARLGAGQHVILLKKPQTFAKVSQLLIVHSQAPYPSHFAKPPKAALWVNLRIGLRVGCSTLGTAFTWLGEVAATVPDDGIATPVQFYIMPSLFIFAKQESSYRSSQGQGRRLPSSWAFGSRRSTVAKASLPRLRSPRRFFMLQTRPLSNYPS